MGGRSKKWLKAFWRDTRAGLAALGQHAGLCAVPEYYAYLPVHGGVVQDPWWVSGAGPRAGHPERLVEDGAGVGTAEEAVLWAQLAGVWADADPRGGRPPRRQGPPAPRE
ncbi:DUF6059 family protein [Streptomyces californicus]|uniref:DUF6059 family protein n=1 Tax=Streptomyces californicus TaxID=67351 RepID=UPI0037BB33C6